MCGAGSREPGAAGPGLAAVTPARSVRTRVRCRRGTQRGAGRQPGTRASCPVAVRGRASRRLGDDHRRVIGGRSRLGLRGPGAGGAVVCGVPSPSLPGGRGGYPFSPHFSRCPGSGVSKPRPCAPRLALRKTGNKCLDFQILPCIPKRHLPSPVHSIIINCLFSVMHFKLRSILSFIHRAANGSF